MNTACKIIGPACKCFCDHRYKDHLYIKETDSIECQSKGCLCTQYNYLPIRKIIDNQTDHKISSVTVNIHILIIMLKLKNADLIVQDALKDLIQPGLVNVDINIWNIKPNL